MKFEDDKPLYRSPPTRSQLRYGGQGAIVIGLSMLAWSAETAVYGYPFDFSGRAGVVEMLIVGVFGYADGSRVATGLIALFGIGCIKWGCRAWRSSGKANLP